MFKSLRTSTKLFLLCGVFVGALFVATYGLVAEKRIAIEFVRRELVGVQHLEALRGVYASILTQKLGASTVEGARPTDEGALAAPTPPDSASWLDTAELEGSLADAVGKLGSDAGDGEKHALIVGALSAARNLAARIGDDSNLALDPDLDSYYVQDIVATKMPTLLSQIGELQSQLQTPFAVGLSPDSLAVRSLILDGMIRSTLEGIERDLRASYRGGDGAHLKQALGAGIDSMVSAGDAYLQTVKASLAGGNNTAALDRSYAAAVDSAINAWTVSQIELKRLLNLRLSKLLSKLRNSLLLNGLLAALSLAFALITQRHIVRPLQKLERLADEVGQTKDYTLRTDYESGDEIGRLAVAFNAMLAELAAAREREVADTARTAAMQAELARIARITTMGEMAASIAHEINQPLAAIVNNANATLRWLSHQPPNVERARSVIKGIADDGARASEVIGSIRSMLEKSSQERAPLDVNDLIREVMTLARGDLRHHGVTVRTELADDLPRLPAVRIQLQQVLLNLTMNAVESMGSIADRPPVLCVRSQRTQSCGILISVEDTGAGIDQGDLDQIFEPFFSTKPEGMGMGLSICRSIVEAHGGRITALRGSPWGSVFQITLPDDELG